MILVKMEPLFSDWRDKARQLLSRKILPEDVDWITVDDGFSFGERWEEIVVTEAPNVPKKFLELAQLVSAYRDPSTWNLLYRLLFRIVYQDKNLLESPLDKDVIDLFSRERLVKRDIHKMKAFVRFKEVKTDDDENVYMAWHRPDHRILRIVAPFFKDRFNGMKWVIMTEDESVSWDKENLSFFAGVPKEDFAIEDSKEDLWKTYYRSIFNPARIKISAMKKELPVRHWKTLPETELITELIQEAPERLESFYQSQVSVPIIRSENLSELSLELAKCRACGICEKATAPVPGFGPEKSTVRSSVSSPGMKKIFKENHSSVLPEKF
jgi:probable DNA metabolism protein